MADAHFPRKAKARLQASIAANIAFYLGVPIAMGLCFGISQTPFGGQFSTTYSIAIWVTNILIFWSAAGLATAGLEWLSRTLHCEPEPVLTLVAGGVVGKLISLWPREWVVEFVLGLGGYAFSRRIQTMGDVVATPSSLELFVVISNSLLLPIAYWVTARLLLAIVTERYGLRDSRSAMALSLRAGAPAAPYIRGPQDLQRAAHLVVALRSEQNYVRVILESSETLVRMTMHEAVAALADVDGMHVHRSYWVNFAYVEKVKRIGRKRYIMCRNGYAIPLSDARYAAVQSDPRFNSFAQNTPAGPRVG